MDFKVIQALSGSNSGCGCEEQRSLFSHKGNMKKKSDSDCGSGCGNSGQKMKSGSDSGSGCGNNGQKMNGGCGRMEQCSSFILKNGSFLHYHYHNHYHLF